MKCENKTEKRTPVLFLFVSTRDTVKVAARFGELSTPETCVDTQRVVLTTDMLFKDD